MPRVYWTSDYEYLPCLDVDNSEHREQYWNLVVSYAPCYQRATTDLQHWIRLSRLALRVRGRKKLLRDDTIIVTVLYRYVDETRTARHT